MFDGIYSQEVLASIAASRTSAAPPKSLVTILLDFGCLVRFPIRDLFVRLLRSFARQCRSHCYCLLDWNAHAHQHTLLVWRWNLKDGTKLYVSHFFRHV